MITSYTTDLPSPSALAKAVEASPETVILSSRPETQTLLWEDGSGNEIRIVKNDGLILLIMNDSESSYSKYPSHPHRQTALLEAPEEVEDLIDKIKPEIVWEWDDTEELWYTAAFWTTDNKHWETSYDWEEDHDEDSLAYLIEVIHNEIL